MKRAMSLIIGIALAAGIGSFLLVATATASVSKSGVSVVIQPALRGCHEWSLTGGSTAATVHVVGSTMTFVNEDVGMTHTLYEQAGAPVSYLSNPAMNVGASVTVRFPKRGYYFFGTKNGKNPPGVKETGRENVLWLEVVVS
jgi:hypothetical protein